ncbi:MAG: hypothetical protein EXR86_01630 [Gammaproteobacteria bacterium]|nr:hypothetical protein [Gammaproteobacteria bacterium]
MSAAALRARIYGGEIIRRPATPTSLAFVDGVMGAIGTILGPDPRSAEVDVHAALAGLREHAMVDSGWWAAIAAVIAETGFDLSQQRVDSVRVRALAAFLAPEAAPRGAYAVHRDTWYANPACQVNWWLAVHDVDETESFAFYPEYFARPIANDSALLDYTKPPQLGSDGRWLPAHAPDALVRPPASEAQRFSLARGELLLFSGAHLHGGVPVTSGRIRFSLDFRTVDEGDLAEGLGAPVLDVECKGQTVQDYLKLGPLVAP